MSAGHIAYRETLVWVKPGDIIINRDGKRKEVVKGNLHLKDIDSYVAIWNANFIRAREVREPETLFEMTDGIPDYMEYANQIELAS